MFFQRYFRENPARPKELDVKVTLVSGAVHETKSIVVGGAKGKNSSNQKYTMPVLKNL